MDTTNNKSQAARALKGLWDLLTEAQRQSMVELLEVRSYRHDDIVFEEGDQPSYLMYLLQGKVAIYEKTDTYPPRNHILRMVEPGFMFGYGAAINDNPYDYRAIAGDDTKVAFLPWSFVQQLIRDNYKVSVLFIKDLSSLLRLAAKHTIMLTNKHVRGRLAAALLRMKEKYGVENDGSTLAIYLSREDLAGMSNMTVSNAIRTLSSFIAEGVVELNERKIRFLNIKELEHIAKIG